MNCVPVTTKYRLRALKKFAIDKLISIRSFRTVKLSLKTISTLLTLSSTMKMNKSFSIKNR